MGNEAVPVLSNSSWLEKLIAQERVGKWRAQLKKLDLSDVVGKPITVVLENGTIFDMVVLGISPSMFDSIVRITCPPIILHITDWVGTLNGIRVSADGCYVDIDLPSELKILPATIIR